MAQGCHTELLGDNHISLLISWEWRRWAGNTQEQGIFRDGQEVLSGGEIYWGVWWPKKICLVYGKHRCYLEE